MSADSASTFMSDLDTNKALRDNVLPLFEKYPATKDQLLAAATKAGYSFTVDELEAATKKMYGDELSQDQLDAIAAGSGDGCCCCTIASSCC